MIAQLSFRTKLTLALAGVACIVAGAMPLASGLADDAADRTQQAQIAVSGLDKLVLLQHSINLLLQSGANYARDPSIYGAGQLDERLDAVDDRLSDIPGTSQRQRELKRAISAETRKSVTALKRDVRTRNGDVSLLAFETAMTSSVEVDAEELSHNKLDETTSVHKRMMSDVSSFSRRIERLLFIALLVIGGLALILPSMFAARLRKLKDAAARIAGGELDVHLETQGKDELATLAESFNTMSNSLRARQEENRELLEAQTERATRDSLTNLKNHRFFHQLLGSRLEASNEIGTPVTIAVLDLDNFKQVNDTYGHAAGDDVLCFVAKQLQAQTRSGDVCCRIGGEEFGISFEGIELYEATQILMRIADGIRHNGPDGREITFSAGLASGVGIDASSLFRQADDAAYEAKRAGKDRVHVHGWDAASDSASLSSE